MSDIEKLIKDLDVEIRNTEQSEEKEAQLMRLQEISQHYDGDDRVVSSEELIEFVKNQPEKAKFYTGFKILDEKMEGFTTGESIFLTGITKHGKTSMCMELSARFVDQHPLWLSFEEKAVDLVRKFHAKTGTFPVFYTPRRNEFPTLSWVEKRIVEAKAKYDSKVVFIDHIGFISDAEVKGGETEASRLERISRAIHSLAVRWDVLIVLMGHLTKVRTDQNPDIENIKGSSAMAQESDLTIILWRRTQRIDGRIEIMDDTNLSLQANRRGKSGNVEFVYENGRFQEREWNITGARRANEELWENTP